MENLEVYPILFQEKKFDCGVTCLKMIAMYHAVSWIDYLENDVLDRELSLLELNNKAIKLGFKTLAVEVDIQTLMESVYLPCILFVKKNHFVVLYKIEHDIFYMGNPSSGYWVLEKQFFVENWQNFGAKGVALMMYI